ncbi:hypothetical protein J2D73_03210 [Acetobacter sacchari]|uniref:Glycosyl transferase n=1 Tax=Acetobacter sacchari TaxID=2661687 RepID=A0ABS3LSC2_9PROT|nr:hypothetical protein [Acetobacter sacchari]MBO1358808.1 hypothetical protein [Acetobacter sacchari]
MKRLVLCSSVSGQGHIKHARYADRVINTFKGTDFPEKFPLSIFGPLPEYRETTAYFQTWQWLRRQETVTLGGVENPSREHFAPGADLFQYMKTFDSVECWFDPTTSGQVALVHFLVYVARHAYIPTNVLLIHSTTRTGETDAETFLQLTPEKIPLCNEHLQAALRFWDAYGQPNPCAFANLKPSEIEALPLLYDVGRAMLTELPAHDTALTATETAFVKATKHSSATPITVTGDAMRELGECRFDLHYFDDSLVRLGCGLSPVIDGLLPDPIRRPPLKGEPFPDEAYKAYRNARLRLTALGQLLAERQADMSAHNLIHYWWGNTEIKNDNLWRWNEEDQRVVAPH